MIEPSFRALLVPFVGLPPLLTASLLAAFGTAILVAPVAVQADEKHLAAGLPQARSLEENCFVAVNRRHALSQAGLDNGIRSWQVRTSSVWSYLPPRRMPNSKTSTLAR